MIEKEIKIMMNEEEYNKALALFKLDKVIVQKNHYYSCEVSFRRNITIRIREIGNKFFLQVKVPVSEERNLSVKREYEAEVNGVTPVIAAQKLYELTGTEFDEARYMGILETHRSICRPNSHTEICIDRNIYFGIVDYELEIEYTGEYPSEQLALLNEAGINCDKALMGKYSRFIVEYMKTQSS